MCWDTSSSVEGRSARLADLTGAMQRGRGGRKRKERDDGEEEERRRRKRGKEEASEDEDMEEEEEEREEERDEYDITYSSHKQWSEEEDARLIMLRTYVHRSGLRLSWTHVAERMPNRSKAAVMCRWKQIANQQQQSEHALQLQDEHRAWDDEQDEQLRALKRQGLAEKVIASRMGRSVGSVQSRWRRIADNSEKQQFVQFSDAEDRLLLRLASKRPCWSWRRITRRFPGRSAHSLQGRLQHLQHSADKRVGKWTRREQVLVKCCVAAGAKPTLIAKRLRTRTPKQVGNFIRRHNLGTVEPWRAQEYEWLRAAVAAAKRLRIDEHAGEASWSVATWRWVAVYVGRGWLDCLARVEMLEHTHEQSDWTRSELVELARVMLLPRGDRAADYHVAFGRTKKQCMNRWSVLKRNNPTLLASVVAEATATGPSSGPSTSPTVSAAGARVRRLLSSLNPKQRMIYELAKSKGQSA